MANATGRPIAPLLLARMNGRISNGRFVAIARRGLCPNAAVLSSDARMACPSASWINQVERWFAEITRKQIRRGVHTSTKKLETDIRAFIERPNENPKPYRWTKSADEILASVRRFCQKAEQTSCSEF